MVAGNQQHVTIRAEASTDRADDRLCDHHRLLGAALKELDRVAEQHKAIDVVERHEQALERSRVQKNAVPEPAAQVQIGDDE